MLSVLKLWLLGAGWTGSILDSYMLYRQLGVTQKYIDHSQPNGKRIITQRYLSFRYAVIHTIIRRAITTGLLCTDAYPWAWTIGGAVSGRMGLRDGPLSILVQSISTRIIYTSIARTLSFPFYTLGHLTYDARHRIPLKPAMFSWIRYNLKDIIISALCEAGVAAVVVGAETLLGRRRLRTLVKVACGITLSVPLCVFAGITYSRAFRDFCLAPAKEIGPIPSGELHDRVKVMTEKVRFPMDRIRVTERPESEGQEVIASDPHDLAMNMSILWLSRISISSKLLVDSTSEESAGIIAHELGHWYHGHTSLNLPFRIPTGSVMMAGLYLSTRPWFFEGFGFAKSHYAPDGSSTYSTTLAVMLLEVVIRHIGPCWSLMKNMLSHRNEYQADRFASSIGHGEGLAQALHKLHERDRLQSGMTRQDAPEANANLDWLYMLHSSHPRAQDRIERLEQLGREK